eukprot:7110040-Heterocapsa_arctica.AAC.1
MRSFVDVGLAGEVRAALSRALLVPLPCRRAGWAFLLPCLPALTCLLLLLLPEHVQLASGSLFLLCPAPVVRLPAVAVGFQ